MVRYIAYTSRATPGLAPAQIDTILLQARDFNAHVQVSGILLYDGQRFFQYLEGTPYAATEAMWRIRHSSLHDHIHLLADASAPAREFNRWYMDFGQTTASHLQQLENMAWQSAQHHKQTRDQPSAALVALNNFLSLQPIPPGTALMNSRPPRLHA